jgi:hypothetical protein
VKPSQVRFYTRELGATLEIEKAIAKLRSIVTPSTEMGHCFYLQVHENRRIGRCLSNSAV